MTHHDTSTGEKKPSVLDKILHPHRTHQAKHPEEVPKAHDAATQDSAVTPQDASASANGLGVNTPIAATNEASLTGPGVNPGAHAAY